MCTTKLTFYRTLSFVLCNVLWVGFQGRLSISASVSKWCSDWDNTMSMPLFSSFLSKMQCCCWSLQATFYDPVFMGIALKPWNVGMGFIVAMLVCWSLPIYFIRRNRRLVEQFKAIFCQTVFFLVKL